VVVLSDGRQLPEASPNETIGQAMAMGAPVHVLSLGGPVAARDLELAPVRRHVSAFTGQSCRIQVRVTNANLGNAAPTIELVSPDGTVLGRTQVRVEANTSAVAAFAVAAPDERTYIEYTLRTPAWPGETTLANNETSVGLSVLDTRAEVLLVEGMPYWDSKFLAQLLRRQPHLRVTETYRLAPEKYYRINPDGEESDSPAAEVFPASAEAFAGVDIVVFGKGAEYFIGSEQAAALSAFVRRGGCVVFARGRPSTRDMPGLADVEPARWGPPVVCDVAWCPTTLGAEAGLFGERLPGLDDTLWDRLPSVSRFYRCESLQPFAQVLVEGRSRENQGETGVPLLVTRRVGRGLAVAVNADSLWHWDFFPIAEEAKETYQAFWPELIQWTLTHAEFLPGQPLALRLSRRAASRGDTIRLRVATRGNGKADAPRVRVFRGGQAVFEPGLVQAASGGSGWHALFAAPEPGSYRIEASAALPDGEARVSTPFQVLPPPSEPDDVSADPAFLARLANETGGRVVEPGEVEELLAMQERERSVQDTASMVWECEWDRAWVLLVAAALFAAEWYLRRRSGLL